MPEEMSKGEKKVALVYYSFSSFVRQDYEILSNHYNVRKVNFRKPRDIFRIMSAVMKSDVSFSWFAGGHAFLAVLFSKIFRKKSIVVVGGYDVAYVPEIDYGQFTQSWPKRAMTRFALRYADRVLVVDPSLKDDAIKNAGISGDNFESLPTGYDYEKFSSSGKKKDIVMTVCIGDDWSRIRIKGIDTFVKAAEYLSDMKFLVIGLSGDALDKVRKIAPSNVELIGPVPQEKLISCYQEAKIYCQLSIREGLPNALCEAMLCECVPVGTNCYGIPTAIGDCGFYAPYGDPAAAAEAIKKALNSPDKGKRARERSKELFTLERRDKRLAQLVEEI
ncbi:MAG TPA: glycosyltransferase family 4 protein [Methanotrichaceae archaeon]|nr:glycosyltransferase family 4 protein [Methanotrichaceae archaeon]